MTSIKPPSSGPGGPQPFQPADGSDGTAQSSKTGPADASAFQRTLAEANQASQAQHVASSAAAGAGGADPVAALAQAVESGAVTMDQAVGQLLEQTVQKAGRQLTAAQREELSELLRSALLGDPTLSGLRG